MVAERHFEDCPLCGQEGIYWFNDGTHSTRYDIEDAENLSICYTYESAFDGRVPDAVFHVYDDVEKNPEYLGR